MRNFKRNRSRGFRGGNNRSFGQYRSNGQGSRPRYRSRGASLNPLMFVKRAVDVVETPYEPVNSFSDFSTHVTHFSAVTYTFQ